MITTIIGIEFKFSENVFNHISFNNAKVLPKFREFLSHLKNAFSGAL